MLSRCKASDLSTLMFPVTWSGFSDLDHGKSYIPYGMPWPRSTSMPHPAHILNLFRSFSRHWRHWTYRTVSPTQTRRRGACCVVCVDSCFTPFSTSPSTWRRSTRTASRRGTNSSAARSVAKGFTSWQTCRFVELFLSQLNCFKLLDLTLLLYV